MENRRAESKKVIFSPLKDAKSGMPSCDGPRRPKDFPLNERQIKILNRMLDGFEGKLTSSKWAALAKCSPDTALRDLNDLIARGVLRKSAAGGRSTSYEIARKD